LHLEGVYDLTSSYFEGQAESNPQAKRGYSRDKRPDCKQVLVGLVLDGEGFPKAHEVFEGNRQDRSTVEEMLESLEKRTSKKPGSTVVVDRGMAYDENLKQIRARGHHYIVAPRQPETNYLVGTLTTRANPKVTQNVGFPADGSDARTMK